MKKVDLDVRHIARLARLRLSPEEEKKMEVHFRRMLEFVEILDELDLRLIEPMVYPHEGFQRLRDDVPRKGLERENALMDAPDQYLFYFRVPSPLRKVMKRK